MNKLLIVILVASFGWNLNLQFREIPKLEKNLKGFEQWERSKEGVIESLKKDLKNSNEETSFLKKENQELLAMLERKNQELAPVIIVAEKNPEPVEEEKIDKTSIMSVLNSLREKKSAEKAVLDSQIAEIDQTLSRGRAVLDAHLKITPNFKEGNIRTSDADRKRWFDQHQARESYLKSEISKLEIQKGNLKREFNSSAAKIDLEIQRLEREVQ
jgi:hypothetical protein